MNLNTIPVLICDFYKVSHRAQYPEGTEYVYSTWTARSNKHHPTADKVVAFNFSGFAQRYLVEMFDQHFFGLDKEGVVEAYKRVIKYALGIDNPDASHIEDLHDLGYLPIEMAALPEGSVVPMRVPLMTIVNTDPRFFWLTNALETLISAELWHPCTAATIAREYWELLHMFAQKTGNVDFVKFQGHDFSMRGLSGTESAASIGAGHLLSFVGTDTIPAIGYLEQYYEADIEQELVGTSIPATEHSVMCAGGDGADEFATYKRLITEVYPTGFISIVSDTWDLWACIDQIIAPLKETIMNRDGKVVIRPDSGNPVKIICGYMKDEIYYDSDTVRCVYTDRELSQMEIKGLAECLWDIFGGTVNDKGFKELDPHIGMIYGDSITLEVCSDICMQLALKKFASTNMVFGIGSYTYQYNTRDTFGFAMKSTACTINGIEKMIYKNPATDDGTKKSNTGRIAVIKQQGEYVCIDSLSAADVDQVCNNELSTVFFNGALFLDSLSLIRERLEKQVPIASASRTKVLSSMITTTY